jgi:putative Mn2+ efflux pump MntP
MTYQIIVQVILFGIALSMDAFAVSVTDGLIYQDINKKKGLFIAGVFGFMQALMPLCGYFLVELVTLFVDKEAGEQTGEIMSLIVTWLAFGLLIFIGSKMLIEAIVDMKKPVEEKKIKLFSYKEVLLFGVATAIDALATGVAFHAGLSNNITIWLHALIIMIITFVISFAGVMLSHKIQKVLKGKYEITSIIGGTILIILAIWIILSHYLGI